MDSIIFDIDGTLWDSREVVAKAWNRALLTHSTCNIEISPSRLTSLFGKPMPEIFAALLPGFSEKEYADAAAICYEAQTEAMKTEGGVLYPGVAETIPLLAKKYPLYIVSNCQCGYIEDFLRLSGLSSYFRGWLCYGDTKKSKGQTILALMKRYQLHSPVYLGDIMGDALACYEARIPFIYASYGFGDVDESCYAKKITKFPEMLEA
ncbi:MAG: HAD family hydrolase [Eubacteriales bacterium]|nr:HAD family hydrolase [Eubacteriales bacterium]